MFRGFYNQLDYLFALVFSMTVLTFKYYADINRTEVENNE